MVSSIGGDLEIHTSPAGRIEIAEGAQILGETREVREPRAEPRNPWLDRLLSALLLGVAALLTGLAFRAVAPSLFGERVHDVAALGRSLGIGVLALIGVPIAAVLLACTVVGIPLAVIGIFAYLAALFLAFVAAAAQLGSALLRDEPTDLAAFATQLALGLAILLLVLNLPYVGGLLRSLTLVFGLGLLVTSLVRGWRLQQMSLE